MGRRWAVSVDAGQRGDGQHCMGRRRDDDPPPRMAGRRRPPAAGSADAKHRKVWRADDDYRRPQCLMTTGTGRAYGASLGIVFAGHRVRRRQVSWRRASDVHRPQRLSQHKQQHDDRS